VNLRAFIVVPSHFILTWLFHDAVGSETIWLFARFCHMLFQYRYFPLPNSNFPVAFMIHTQLFADTLVNPVFL
jgi:hypothetical protein